MTILHSMADAASRGKMSLPTLARRIRDNRGPARVRVGRAYAITEASLIEWLAREGPGV